MEPATRFELVSTAYETVALPIEPRRLVALAARLRAVLTLVASGATNANRVVGEGIEPSTSGL